MPLLRIDHHVIPASDSRQQLARSVVVKYLIYGWAQGKDGSIALLSQNSYPRIGIHIFQSKNRRNQQDSIAYTAGTNEEKVAGGGKRSYLSAGETGRYY
ncbi:hypothetical protein [Geobacter sp. AOG1]|uniref:hypothetical protein n=1 Tax=Geobacter sp. AOG1 TaxID=1566346 RepID=UPI001CC42028|nr:hypothetical protein [Geobacter sp. AOG1]